MRKWEKFLRILLYSYQQHDIDTDTDIYIYNENQSVTDNVTDIGNDRINEVNLTEYVLERIKELDSYRQQEQSKTKSASLVCAAVVEEVKLNDYEQQQKDCLMKNYANVEAKRILHLLLQRNNNESILSSSPTSSRTILKQQQSIDKQIFIEKLRQLATEIDTAHTIPISISMLLVGSSVGIVIPIMPYIVSKLGLSAGQYGIVVSSFALAKLFANVPAAVMVEKHGRKPYLVYSLAFISMGVGGIGLASEFEHLVLCRLMTGIGVSALSTVLQRH